MRGIQVRTNHGHVPLWWQPILHQPETAIIGFLAKEFDGVLHLLAQVKTEPGDVHPAQLAPTVQSTRGGCLRSHRGAAAPYLEYFLQRCGRVLVDVLQSEPGSWVLGRQNRNMVLEVTDDIEHDDNYAWLTLGQIYELMKHPHLVNVDTRTVLACLPLPVEPPAWHGGPATRLSLASGSGAGGRSGLSGWLARRQAHYRLSTSLVPLNHVLHWHRRPWETCHRTGKYFSIIGVAVAADADAAERTWCQPLLEPCGDGLVAFVIHRGAEGLRVLVHADVRPGYRQAVEIGPSVQCTPRNFAESPRRQPEFVDLVLSDDVLVHYDVSQSEEGGRFHHAVTRHLIVEVGDPAALGTPPNYFWVTPAELNDRIRSGCQVNSEARSLFACLQAVW